METLVDTNSVRGGAESGPRKANLFQTPNFFLDVHVLAPGQAAKVHAHAREDKVYVVLSGRPTLVLAGEERTGEPGHALFCPAGMEHGVRNEGGDEARLLVFMAPHPRPATA